MQLVLELADDEVGRETSALYQWLLRERALRGHAQVTSGSAQAGDAMGSAVEWVNVVVANAIALGSLLTTLATWRATRPSAPTVRIEVNGVTVAVDRGDPEFIALLTERLREAGDRRPSGGDS
ncbi:hypothetical protein ACH429_03460 [Streptomyces pathocidini]|uniref:Uncharacterized protein n=1 Tax=Streptomyces pathocidini TaxID=1650571 RepID=A0ABW7UKI5_9ACTN|nr:hypothetical protein [Streptomyces pathocidini]